MAKKCSLLDKILAELRGLAVLQGLHIGLPRNAHSFDGACASDAASACGANKEASQVLPELERNGFLGHQVGRGEVGQQWTLCCKPENDSLVMDCELPEMEEVRICFRSSLRLDAAKKRLVKCKMGSNRVGRFLHSRKRTVTLYVKVATAEADDRQLCACGAEDKADAKGTIELDAASGHYVCSACGVWTARDLSQHSFLDAAYKAEWGGPDQRRAEVQPPLKRERRWTVGCTEAGRGRPTASASDAARCEGTVLSSEVQKKHRVAQLLASKALKTQDASAVAAVLSGATLPVSEVTQKLLATRAAVFAVSVNEELQAVEKHVGRFGAPLTQHALSKSTAVFLQSIKHRYVAQCNPKTCSICIHDSNISSRESARAVLQHVLVGSGSHSINSMLASHAQKKLKALFSKRGNGFAPLPALQASVALLSNAHVVLKPCIGPA